MVQHDVHVSSRDVLRLAAEADVDPRSASKYVRGVRPRGRPGERLDDAARRLGLPVVHQRAADEIDRRTYGARQPRAQDG